jgi:hypothetical protein
MIRECSLTPPITGGYSDVIMWSEDITACRNRCDRGVR